MSDETTSDYVTIDAAATKFEVSKGTVRNWIRDGVIPAVRIGDRTIRIRRVDLEAAATPVVGGERGQWTRLG
jgi:excisionase family DNA binding protein